MPSTLDDLLSFLKLAKPGQPLEALGQLDARTQCMVLVWALRQRGHADPDGRVADIQIRRESSGVLTHGKPRVHAVGIKQKNRRVLVDLNGNVGFMRSPTRCAWKGGERLRKRVNTPPK